MSEFINMGGHGPYIWFSYFLSIVVIGTVGIVRHRRLKRLRLLNRDQIADASDTQQASPEG